MKQKSVEINHIQMPHTIGEGDVRMGPMRGLLGVGAHTARGWGQVFALLRKKMLSDLPILRNRKERYSWYLRYPGTQWGK